MNKKILIFVLCTILLFALFSVNVFADSTSTIFTFVDSPDFGAYLDSIDRNYFSTGHSFTSNDTFYSNAMFYRDKIRYYIGTEHITVWTSSDGWVNENYKTLVFENSEVYNLSGDILSNYGSWTINHTHSYTSNVVSPTCTEKGYTLYTCECGHSYSDTETNPLGHRYSPAGTTPSTCTKKGYTTYLCSSCGDSYIDNELDLIPHSFVSVVTPPTVSKKGFTTHTCSMCSYSYIDSYVDDLPSSEDSILNVWDHIAKNFFTLFGSAQSIFFDGNSITFLGGLLLLSLAFGFVFLFVAVFVNFLRFRG